MRKNEKQNPFYLHINKKNSNIVPVPVKIILNKCSSGTKIKNSNINNNNNNKKLFISNLLKSSKSSFEVVKNKESTSSSNMPIKRSSALMSDIQLNLKKKIVTQNSVNQSCSVSKDIDNNINVTTSIKSINNIYTNNNSNITNNTNNTINSSNFNYLMRSSSLPSYKFNLQNNNKTPRSNILMQKSNKNSNRTSCTTRKKKKYDCNCYLTKYCKNTKIDNNDILSNINNDKMKIIIKQGFENMENKIFSQNLGLINNVNLIENTTNRNFDNYENNDYGQKDNNFYNNNNRLYKNLNISLETLGNNNINNNILSQNNSEKNYYLLNENQEIIHNKFQNYFNNLTDYRRKVKFLYDANYFKDKNKSDNKGKINKRYYSYDAYSNNKVKNKNINENQINEMIDQKESEVLYDKYINNNNHFSFNSLDNKYEIIDTEETLNNDNFFINKNFLNHSSSKNKLTITKITKFNIKNKKVMKHFNPSNNPGLFKLINKDFITQNIKNFNKNQNFEEKLFDKVNKEIRFINSKNNYKGNMQLSNKIFQNNMKYHLYNNINSSNEDNDKEVDNYAKNLQNNMRYLNN